MGGSHDLRRGVWPLFAREYLRFIRQPARIVAVLVMPMLLVFIIGAGFGQSFSTRAQQGYAEFVQPGAVLLGALFSAIFSTLSVIDDRESGFLQAVVTAPGGRLNFAAAKLLSGTLFAMAQAMVTYAVLALASPAAISSWPVLLLATFVVCAFLVALGFAVAWRVESVATYHSAMNSVFMPMWLLSGALFPIDEAAGWLQGIMRLNPLTPMLTWVRLGPQASLHAVGWSLLLSVLMVAYAFVVGGRDARARTNA